LTAADVDRPPSTTALSPFPLWRRAVAFLLDVLIFAPPIAFFCVAGSFATESTHHGFSALYVIAGAIAAALPACEIFIAGSPGLLLMRGRIRRANGMAASVSRRLLRAVLKYVPLTLPYILLGSIMLLDRLGMKAGVAMAAVVIAVLLVLIGYFVVGVVRKNIRRRELPASWFDRYADTRVFHRNR
jgi:hypothetical protein